MRISAVTRSGRKLSTGEPRPKRRSPVLFSTSAPVSLRMFVAHVARLIPGCATNLGSTGGSLIPAGPDAHEASKMKNFDSFVGLHFGRLTVQRVLFNGRRTLAHYLCSCGGSKEARPCDLTRGFVTSCGCAARDAVVARNKSRATHGHTGTTEYKIWSGIIARCTNPDDKYFPRYGGRGITVCERWLDFGTFLADMGHRPGKGFSIDRIDNDGPYAPENCHWATWKEQENNRRNNRVLTISGESHTVSEWAGIVGVNAGTIFTRLRKGFAPELAILKRNFRSDVRPEAAKAIHLAHVKAGRAAAKKRWGS